MALAAIFVILAAVVGSAAMVGMFAWMLTRMRRLESGDPGRRPELARVVDQIEEMRDHLITVQDEVARLNERVDFTERLLEPADEEPRPSESSGEPPA